MAPEAQAPPPVNSQSLKMQKRKLTPRTPPDDAPQPRQPTSISRYPAVGLAFDFWLRLDALGSGEAIEMRILGIVALGAALAGCANALKSHQMRGLRWSACRRSRS